MSRLPACSWRPIISEALDHSLEYRKLGHNRGVMMYGFDTYQRYDEDDYADELKRNLIGTTWAFDMTFTSNRFAKVTVTITKEGRLPTVVERVVDFNGDSINLDELPEELLLPDDPPQASGEDVAGVEVAAGVSASRIGSDDVQVFLVSASGADHRPGDWLEPKDGSNQRMMIVEAGQAVAAALPSPRHTSFSRSDQPGVPGESSKSSLSTLALLGTSTGSKASELPAEALVASYASGGLSVAEPVRASSTGSGIVPLSVVCMQIEQDIPTRGARYFSQPKPAEGPVQTCQRNCVLSQSRNIQNCVWRCESTAQARRAQSELRFDDTESSVRFEHTLPLVMSASSPVQQGFVRIINHSDLDGTVEIHAIDDSGRRSGPISLDMEARTSAHFNSGDLESGNADKGLSGGVGDGHGDWRLELNTALDIEPLAYVRTTGGFVTAMHDVVAEGESTRYHVPIFNPGGNRSQVSRLRLINPTGTEAEVTIDGLDDHGEPPDEEVLVTLPANGARTISAQELELGGIGLSGGFGDGAGKWQLFVSTDRPIQVMSLLRSPTGHLTNLSTSTSQHFGRSGYAPADQAAFDALVVGNRLRFDDDPFFYWQFVSPGRFFAPDDTEEDGRAEGNYTYENTGPDSGTLEVRVEDAMRCALQLTFDSPATGSAMVACTFEDDTGQPFRAEWEWRLEDTSVAGFAPADQDAFDALVVGKRLVGHSDYHFTFVSPGRFRVFEDGETSTGGYAYENTGPNSGLVVLDYDDGDHCSVELTFDSPTTGAILTCTAEDETGQPFRAEFQWRLVDIPAVGFAPADQTAFDALVVGRRVIGDDPSNHIDFVSAGRFREIEGSETYTGRYTYQNTGPNSGRLELGYDDGDRCTSNLAFDSVTTGTSVYSCDDGSTGSSRWRLEDIDETVPADDKGVLVALYNATGGASWTNNTNWLSSAPIGQWYGVTTDESGRVIELDLVDNRLSGAIPAELGRLSNLEYLWLGQNQLSGPIPSGLGRLSNLEGLGLGHNQLSGPIPSGLGQLSNLGGLYLSNNELSGPIPSELGRLFNLSDLRLDGNRLSGPIPSELGGLFNLEVLFLGFNRLSGPIPAELGRLSNLGYLDLESNRLSGSIPSVLGRLFNLKRLSLHSNRLSGPIPSELGRLSNLRELYLESNRLSGRIPTELGSLSNLEGLSLHSNRLNGAIPAELGELSKLERLYLSGNQLSGCIPSGLRDVPTNDLYNLGLEFCGVATGPDLVVSSASVSDSRPGAGESFTPECNRAQPGQWPICCDHIALFPLAGRDDIDRGYAGRHRLGEQLARFRPER